MFNPSVKVGRSDNCTSVKPLCTGVCPFSSLELQTKGLLTDADNSNKEMPVRSTLKL